MAKHKDISVSLSRFCFPLVREGGLCIRHHSFPLAYHKNHGFEITYVDTGSVTWEISDGARLDLHGGDIAITQPEAMHRGEYNAIRPSRLLWIIIAPNASPSCSPFSKKEISQMTIRLRKLGNRKARGNSNLHDLFSRLFEIATEPESKNDHINIGLGRSLLNQIMLDAIKSFSKEQSKPSNSFLQKTLSYMKAHMAEDISISQVAEFTGLSIRQFHTSFRKETGQTPADYLMKLRCDLALQKLREPSASVTDIAFDLGFSSSQYFACCFRKYTGMTPTTYRRRQKQDIV